MHPMHYSLCIIPYASYALLCISDMAVSASQSTRQTWAALQHDGPNHLGLWVTWAALQHDGPNHLGLWVIWTALQHDGPNHLGVLRSIRLEQGRPVPAGQVGHGPQLTAAIIPVDNPGCSCKLTRVHCSAGQRARPRRRQQRRLPPGAGPVVRFLHPGVSALMLCPPRVSLPPTAPMLAMYAAPKR